MSSISTSNESLTYEQKTAKSKLEKSPDPIHWHESYSFRSKPYRHLHHQNGTIGTFHVRIVEAKDLKRSHWSVLGMGVVKHLGLSNAHGEVSSFCSFQLGFRFRNDTSKLRARHQHELSSSSADEHIGHPSLNHVNSNDWQNGNIATTAAAAAAASVSSSSSSPQQQKHDSIYNSDHRPNTIYATNKSYHSTTIPFNSKPKWPSVQTETNKSSFDIPLKKGAMPHDGMEIILSLQMKEEKTAVDSFVPIGKGGSDDGILGVGEINLTALVLQDLMMNRKNENSSTGQHPDFVDVYDKWIPLSKVFQYQLNGQNDKQTQQRSSSNEDNHNGQVRVLISYEPNGFKPQKGDIIAFESFARPSNHAPSKCPIIIPPTHPLKIKDVRGEYILAFYDVIPSTNNTQSAQNKDDGVGPVSIIYDDTSNHYQQNKHFKQGSIRIHRNSIFVIERTNIVDTAIDLTLKPADIIMSTSMGQNMSEVAQPYVEAAGELLAPVFLSSKLLLGAGKVGGGALAIGLKSAVVNVVENADPEKRRKAKRSSFGDE